MPWCNGSRIGHPRHWAANAFHLYNKTIVFLFGRRNNKISRFHRIGDVMMAGREIRRSANFHSQRIITNTDNRTSHTWWLKSNTESSIYILVKWRISEVFLSQSQSLRLQPWSDHQAYWLTSLGSSSSSNPTSFRASSNFLLIHVFFESSLTGLSAWEVCLYDRT